jgi:hypothetical protein
VTPWLYALIAHGIIGGLDIVINHEYLARLPEAAGPVDGSAPAQPA